MHMHTRGIDVTMMSLHISAWRYIYIVSNCEECMYDELPALFFCFPISQINNNGIITFNAALPQYTSEPFPLNASDNRMIIAPYWADSDIRSGGTVWHRQTTDQNLLTRARCEVRSAFVDHMDFEPTNLLIATWDHIVYYQDIFFTRDLNNVSTNYRS